MKKILFLILITLSLQAEFIRDDKLNVVIDTERNLMWQNDESINEKKFNWEGAKKYCEDLEFAGLNDWRLPNIDELHSIMTIFYGQSYPDEDDEWAEWYDTNKNLRNKDSFAIKEFKNIRNIYWSNEIINLSHRCVDFYEGDDINPNNPYMSSVAYTECVRNNNNEKFNIKTKDYQNLNSWYKNQYALIIGIDKYENRDIETLSNAVNDAKEIEKIFKNLGFKTTSLYNEEATKKNILKKIKELKNEINSNDSFIIYFAGHGQGLELENREKRGYIIPYDVSFDLTHQGIMDYKFEAISINDLKDFAKDIKAKHIALLLDSCFSGLAMERRGLVLPKNMNMDYYEDLLNQKAIDILTAGEDKPISDGTNHSPFTKALINAFEKKSIDLIDRDGFATFLELATYVKTKVEKTTHRKQKPQFDNLSFEDGDFIFKVR